MRKRLAALLIVAMAAVGMYAVPAQAADCVTGGGGTITAPGNCDIVLSVDVPLTATLTFTTIDTDFGSVVPGTFNENIGGIAGSFSTNGGTATLAVSCITGNPFAAPKTASYFSIKFTAGAYKDLTGSGAGACTTAITAGNNHVRTTEVGTAVFADDVKATIGSSEPAGADFAQTLRYTLTVA